MCKALDLPQSRSASDPAPLARLHLGISWPEFLGIARDLMALAAILGLIDD